jgi:arginyl-tRNA synthetase
MKRALETIIREALKAIGAEAPEHIEIETPRDESFGDLATPVAMGLAKQLKKAPRAIAEDIIANLPQKDTFSKIEIAGPGFINFTFAPAFLNGKLMELITDGPAFLRSDVGGGERVQIEFVSANPTGPLHLGHGRGAAVGQALANLLSAAGYSVEREYYVNDAGRQVQLLAESVYARYQELLGGEHPLPEDGYRGEYIIEAAQALLDAEGEKYKGVPLEEAEAPIREFSLKMMIADIRHDLEDFGVTFETWQSERALHEEGSVRHAIEFLTDKGLIYEKEGALWFNAEKFRDEKNRVVVKNDGMHTYFASDIAYHLKKIERGFTELINIWGADHHGYIPRMEAVIEALGYDREHLKVLLVQIVSLLRGGKPVQMSKRAGNFVTLREVMDEVGADITKFIFLTRRHDSHLSFDLEVAKAQSAENPVFYVQYANARIHSIFKKATNEGWGPMDHAGADLSPLVEPEEMRLIKKLLSYPTVFEQAARAREPHRITFYLRELAGLFHPYYNKHRVLVDDKALAAARLALMEAIRVVLREGLEVLGITAPERM